MKLAILFAALALGATTTGAVAEEQPVTLKPGPGAQIVASNCAGCHSLDYPRINSVFLDRKGWTAEVAKMINAYGAPIAPGDAATIIDYLAKNYGTGG